MKKIGYLLIAIFLLSALFPYKSSEEWVKLSFLWKHFEEHQAENPQITFSDFFYIHYINPQQHQDTSHEHEKLPFQTHHFHTNCQQCYVFWSNCSIGLIQRNFILLPSNFSDFYQAHHYFNYHHAIFQPPKPSFV